MVVEKNMASMRAHVATAPCSSKNLECSSLRMWVWLWGGKMGVAKQNGVQVGAPCSPRHFE